MAAYITRILRAFGIAGEDEIGLGRDAVAAAGASSEGDKALLDIIASFREDVRAAGKGSRPGPDVLALCDRCCISLLPTIIHNGWLCTSYSLPRHTCWLSTRAADSCMLDISQHHAMAR